MVDVRTGGILAAASVPGFDLNRYRTDYATLCADAAAPLLDRVSQGLYAPGSAFKPAVAAAALTAGIDPAATVVCTGRYGFYSGYQPGCLQYGHGGPVDLRTALEYSCNIFFYDVGRRLGVDTFSAMAQQLGLAAPTGAETAEAQGRLTWSADENYQAGLYADGCHRAGEYRRNAPAAGRLCRRAGKQWAAARPALCRPRDKRRHRGGCLAVCAALHRDSGRRERLWPHPRRYGADGPDHPRSAGGPVVCAAKTGSPQLADTLPGGGHYVNSVLIGYAPADAPQIAAAVVLEYGGGGANAAPILRAVLDAVF